jgi:hypothetical protein
MMAFEVTVKWAPQHKSIYKAETRSKARYKAYRAIQDAGLFPRFPDIRVVRAPKFDGYIPNFRLDISGGCIGWDDGTHVVGCLGDGSTETLPIFKPLIIKD